MFVHYLLNLPPNDKCCCKFAGARAPTPELEDNPRISPDLDTPESPQSPPALPPPSSTGRRKADAAVTAIHPGLVLTKEMWVLTLTIDHILAWVVSNVDVAGWFSTWRHTTQDHADHGQEHSRCYDARLWTVRGWFNWEKVIIVYWTSMKIKINKTRLNMY